MADSNAIGGHEFVIAIALKQYENLTKLADAIERVQTLAAKPTALKVGIDPSALAQLKRELAGVRVGGTGEPATPPQRSAPKHDTGGHTSPEYTKFEAAITSMNRELRANTTALNLSRRTGGTTASAGSTGGGAPAKVDLSGLTTAFERVGDKIILAVNQAVAKLPTRAGAATGARTGRAPDTRTPAERRADRVLNRQERLADLAVRQQSTAMTFQARQQANAITSQARQDRINDKSRTTQIDKDKKSHAVNENVREKRAKVDADIARETSRERERRRTILEREALAGETRQGLVRTRERLIRSRQEQRDALRAAGVGGAPEISDIGALSSRLVPRGELLKALETELKDMARGQRRFEKARSELLVAQERGGDTRRAGRRVVRANEDLDATSLRFEGLVGQGVAAFPLPFVGLRRPVGQYAAVSQQRRGLQATRTRNLREFSRLQGLDTDLTLTNESLAATRARGTDLRTERRAASDAVRQATLPGPAVPPHLQREAQERLDRANERARRNRSNYLEDRERRARLVNGDPTTSEPGIVGLRSSLAGRGIQTRDDLTQVNQGLSRGIVDAAHAEGRYRGEIVQRTKALVEAAKVMREHKTLLDDFARKAGSIANYAISSALIFGVAGAARRSISEGTVLESATANIQAVSEGKLETDRTRVSRSVLDNSFAFGNDIGGTAAIAKIFAQTGQSPREVSESTRSALLGVRGAGLEPGQVTELLIAVRNLSDNLVKGEEIIDRISLVESKYAVTAQDISVAIQRVGSLATQLQPQNAGSIDAFDLIAGATTEIIQQTRVTGSQSATSLRFILARLVAPETTRALQDRYDINLAQAGSGGRTLRPLTDLLTDIAKTFQTLKSQGRTIESAQLLTQVGGARQINATAALLDNWGKVMDIARESSLAFGEAQRRLAIEMGTTEAKVKQVNVAFVDYTNELLERTGLRQYGKDTLDSLAGGLRGAKDDPAGALVSKAGSAFGTFGVLSSLLAVGRVASVAGAGAASTGAAVGTLTWLAKLMGVLGRFSAYGTIISGAILGAGVLLKLLERSREAELRVGRERDRVGVVPINAREVLKNSRTTEFANQAQSYGVRPETLAAAVRQANAAAQQAVSGRFGGNPFTINDHARTYDPKLAKAFEEALIDPKFSESLTTLVPGFKDMVQEQDRVNVALRLLRDVLIQESAISGTYTAGLRAQMESGDDEIGDRFAAATQNKPRDPFTTYVKLPDTQYLSELGTTRTREGARVTVASQYTKDNLTDLKAGPGFALTQRLAEAAGLKGTDLTQTYQAILNNLAPGRELFDAQGKTIGRTAGLGDKLATVALKPYTGQYANHTDPLFKMVDRLVKAGKSFGDALDAVAHETLILAPAQKDLVDRVRAAVKQDMPGLAPYAENEQVRLGLQNPERLRALGINSDNPNLAGAKTVLGNQRNIFQANVEQLFETYDIPERLRQQLRESGIYRSQVGGGDFYTEQEKQRTNARTLLVDLLAQNKSPQAQGLLASLRADEDARNRGSERATVNRGSGASYARDRVLDALIRFGTGEGEVRGLRENLGKSGLSYDATRAGQQNAQQLLSGLLQAREATRGDLIKASNDLRNFRLLPAELRQDATTQALDATLAETTERRVAPLSAQNVDAILQGYGEVDPKSKQQLQDRVAYIREALNTLTQDKALFPKLPGQDRQELQNLIGASDGTVLANFGRILEFARRLTEERQKQVLLEEQSVERVKSNVELAKQRLEAAQRLGEIAQDTRIRTAEREGRFGAALLFRRQGIGQSRDNAIALARQDEIAQNQIAAADPRLGDLDRRFKEWTAAIERIKKEEGAILDARNRDAQLIADERNRLADERRNFVNSGVQASTQGLKYALSSFGNLQELQARDDNGQRQLVAAIMEPLVATIQERLVNNFVDSLIGPNGFFKGLSSLFSQPLLQDPEQLLREQGLEEAVESGSYQGVVDGFEAMLGRLELSRQSENTRFSDDMARKGAGSAVPARADFSDVESESRSSPALAVAARVGAVPVPKGAVSRAGNLPVGAVGALVLLPATVVTAQANRSLDRIASTKGTTGMPRAFEGGDRPGGLGAVPSTVGTTGSPRAYESMQRAAPLAAPLVRANFADVQSSSSSLAGVARPVTLPPVSVTAKARANFADVQSSSRSLAGMAQSVALPPVVVSAQRLAAQAGNAVLPVLGAQQPPVTARGGNRPAMVTDFRALRPRENREPTQAELDQMMADYARTPLAKQPNARQITHGIYKAALETGVDPYLAFAMAHAESGFESNVRGKDQAGRDSEYGLFQIHPSNLKNFGLTAETALDPYQNAKAGLGFFGGLMRENDGNAALALGAYNAGPSRARQFGTNFDRYPMPEVTGAYADKILKMSGYRDQFDMTYSGKVAKGVTNARVAQLNNGSIRPFLAPDAATSSLLDSSAPLPVLLADAAPEFAAKVPGFAIDPAVLASVDDILERAQAATAAAEVQAKVRVAQRNNLLLTGAGVVGNLTGGLVGNNLSPNKNANYASEGASLGGSALGPLLGKGLGKMMGAKVGGVLGGPLGIIAGSLLGGVIGGLFKKRAEVKPPEYTQAERIAANTRETVGAIENNNRLLLSVDNRLLNAPASFVLPQYRPIATGAGMTNVRNEYTFGNIILGQQPGQDGAAMADDFTTQLRKNLGSQGTYVTPFE